MGGHLQGCVLGCAHLQLLLVPLAQTTTTFSHQQRTGQSKPAAAAREPTDHVIERAEAVAAEGGHERVPDRDRGFVRHGSRLYVTLESRRYFNGSRRYMADKDAGRLEVSA